jgi:hypothetical protein
MKRVLFYIVALCVLFLPPFGYADEVKHPSCGDGKCDEKLGENWTNCKQDCPKPSVCGNGLCEPGENCENCSQDCGFCSDEYYPEDPEIPVTTSFEPPPEVYIEEDRDERIRDLESSPPLPEFIPSKP